jgi:hypothetical protein
MRAPIKQYRKLQIGKHHRAQCDDARRTDLSGSGRRSKQRAASGAKLPSLAAQLCVSRAPAPGIRTSDQQAVRSGKDALGNVTAQRRARSRAILCPDPSSGRSTPRGRGAVIALSNAEVWA